jgi:hypothetical protein
MGITRKWKSLGARALCVAPAAGLAASVQAAPSILGTPVVQAVAGDANRDGITNFLDFQVLERNFNRPGGVLQGDFDASGFVDLKDFTILSSNLGKRQVPTFFGKIADNGTSVPGGVGAFSLMNPPVIDKGGNVAFLGASPTNIGIYRWSNGSLVRVADTSTPIPSGTGAFSNFGQPSISGGVLAFQGVGASQEGIYTFSSGVLSKAVNRSTPRPDGGGFSDFGDPTLTNNTLAFIASSGLERGAYAVAGAAISSIVNTSTTIPGGWGTFSSFDNAISDGTNYWFVGKGMGQVGIYKKNGVSTVILDQNTQIPGTVGKFTAMGNLSLDGQNLSFNGVMGEVHGVYGVIDGAPRRFVDTNTPIPGGNGRFTQFGVSAIGGAGVAFVGYDQKTTPGIYAWINGELVRVIDTGVTLGGKLITGLDMSRDAVVGNKLTFQAEFADKSSGVFSATLMPSGIVGDVNGDGRANGDDFAVVRQNFGVTGANRSQGDLNGDAKVDFLDFQILEKSQGRFGAVGQPGDADGDGKVNTDDFKLLYANFGKYGTLAQGDFTGDGRVDFQDFQILERSLNKDGNAALIADANNDRLVNSTDFNILWANFGKLGGKAQGDFNADGRVDFRDFQILEQAYLSTSVYPFNPFGATGPLPSEFAEAAAMDALFASLAPEPAVGLLAVGVLWGVMGRRRK